MLAMFFHEEGWLNGKAPVLGTEVLSPKALAGSIPVPSDEISQRAREGICVQDIARHIGLSSQPTISAYPIALVCQQQSGLIEKTLIFIGV